MPGGSHVRVTPGRVCARSSASGQLLSPWSPIGMAQGRQIAKVNPQADSNDVAEPPLMEHHNSNIESMIGTVKVLSESSGRCERDLSLR